MADLAERLFQEFGIEKPAGANEQGAADPAPAADPDPAKNNHPGENEPGPADPENEPDVQGADPGNQADPGDQADPAAGTEEGKQEQTPEERRANAARRREQERKQRQKEIDDAVAAALEAQQKKNDEQIQSIFKKAGLKNPITGEEITDMDKLDAWHAAFQDRKFQQKLKKGELTPEDIQEEVRKAISSQQKQTPETQEDPAFRENVKAQLESIQQLDPNIKTVADLLDPEKFPETKKFQDMVRRGYTYEDAHYLAAKDRIESTRQERAAAAAAQASRGKDHLRGSGNNGGKTVSVPPKIMKMYHALMPNATEAQILAHYQKNYKE